MHGEGPLLNPGWGGLGQDARCSRTGSRGSSRDGEARPSEILAITFTNKAAQEMRERVRAPRRRPRSRRPCGSSTFHFGLRAHARLETPRSSAYTRGVHDLRSRQDSLRHGQGDACDELRTVDPKRFAAARHPPPDLRRQERAARRRGLPAQGVVLLRADRRRRVRPVRAANARRRTRWTSTTCCSEREPLRALPGGARPLPPRLPATCWWTSTRTPKPRPVPLAPACRLRGGAPQPVRGRATTTSAW